MNYANHKGRMAYAAFVGANQGGIFLAEKTKAFRRRSMTYGWIESPSYASAGSKPLTQRNGT